ncbi:hypothetical protein B0O99DRAFT_677131 [Bisporella sp. PMI_857]|nr:hypothetical protein B0O99DRAFT_677131 [Bisporella sp. PMI_857]
MGRNNVRGGDNLPSRAGCCTEIPSVIPEFNDMPIVIIGHNFAQEDLDRHVSLIRYGYDRAWAQLLSSVPHTLGDPPEQPKIAYGPPDQRSTIPKIHISQGMGDIQRLQRYLPQDLEQDSLGQPNLAYILVVQGCSGMFRSKLVLTTNRRMAGAEMFCEAVNGFSIVFTGAVFKTNLEKRRDLGYRFKKADSWDELVAMDADESQKIIGVLC